MSQVLRPLDIVRPGSKGLNLQETGNEDLGFCVDATNCVIDTSGRLAARKGWTPLNDVMLTDGFSASGSNQLSDPRDLTTGNWTPIGTPTTTLTEDGIEGIINTGTIITDNSAAAAQGTTQAVVIPNDSNSNTASIYVQKVSTALTSGFPRFGLQYSGGTNQYIFISFDPFNGTGTVDTSVGTYTIEVTEETSWWRIRLTLANNSSGNVTGTFYVYPAYFDTYGGSLDVTQQGSIIVDYAELLLNTSAYSTQTLTAVGVDAIGSHITGANSETIIFTGANRFYKGNTSITEITGSVTAIADNWQFVNFNGKIIGIQAGHTPIVWTGSGNFAHIVAAGSGTVPTGNAGLSAFGKLWMISSDSDLTKVRYSDNLDETTWSDSASPGEAGELDMKGVIGWGYDTITALAQFQERLVIFGKHNIAIYKNPWNPNNGSTYEVFQLEDMIQGVGCIARDSIVETGNDILFLSDNGVQSLGRTLVQKSSPMSSVSKQVRDDLLTNVSAETDGSITAAYHDIDGFYILVLKNNELAYVFDTRAPLETGDLRCTKWDSINPNAIFHARDDVLYLGQAGWLASNSGYLDHTATYAMAYQSSWQSLGTDLLKLPKKWEILLEGGSGYSLQIRAFFDYINSFRSTTFTIPTSTGLSEWGGGEWGLSEWSGAGDFQNIKAFGKGSGRIIAIGFETTINGSSFAVQRVLIMLKTGHKP